MTNNKNLTTEQALQLHKEFLQSILQEVMNVVATGKAGVERMIQGLNTYWDANLKHAATRRKVRDALMGTSHENEEEPMGRPFQMMLRAELQASHVKNPNALSQKVYEEAREIALAEALSGKQQTARRKKLLAEINAASRDA